VAFGGTGWSARQRFLFDRECARQDAPVLFIGGIRSLGPLLIEQGTPEQRGRFLTPMLSGRDLWCQGFSEPGAGSDLAAISTRAVRDGDSYLVNGSKIWTTGAHHANWMFAIVRTDDSGKRQQGLTFLLIDMTSPGLSVKPIIGLAGDHEFNQVFFDDVRVPVAQRIGAENDGWTMAKRLMQLARSNNTPAALVGRVLRRTAEAVVAAGDRLEPSVRMRLAGLMIELEAFEQLELSGFAAGPVRLGDQALPSMLKLTGSELHQRVAELAMEVAGPQAAATLEAIGLAGAALDDGAKASAKHLCVRAATIYSGTSETQRNVIAHQILANQ
jgi:acyl-CoA dehydrogenase